MTKGICFLDRDGVVVEEVHYLSSPEQVKLTPGAAEALIMLEEAGYKRIVVTNQSGVARGYFDETAVYTVHDYLDILLEIEDASVDAYYFCPHHPKGKVREYSKKCNCRKPEAGMLEQALADFPETPEDILMIGDKIGDLLAGEKVGARGCLVKMGHGDEHAKEAVAKGFQVAENLLEAVKTLLATK